MSRAATAGRIPATWRVPRAGARGAGISAPLGGGFSLERLQERLEVLASSQRVEGCAPRQLGGVPVAFRDGLAQLRHRLVRVTRAERIPLLLPEGRIAARERRAARQVAGRELVLLGGLGKEDEDRPHGARRARVV